MYKKNQNFSILNITNNFSELKNRIFFVIIALIIFRIGSFIPIPGIDTSVLNKLFEQQRGTIIDMFNMFSGGSLSRASIFSLGIMPYISSSIIIQLLTVVNPTLSEIKKEGASGINRINAYTRYGTLLLSIFQAIGISTGLPNMPGMQNLIIQPGLSFYLIAVVSLVTGTMFLMWLGEQITSKGIGNGISIIIFSGIIAGLPLSMGYTIEQTRQGEISWFSLLLILLLVLSITFFVVFVERGQRRIVVHYAKYQQGRKISIAQNTHLPLKVNMAGVIPAIFASSIILFPTTLISWFGDSIGWKWMNLVAIHLQPGQPLYIIIYALSIIFFCFFYTSLIFNSKDTAENLKKSGAFLPGIRPGKKTAEYINNIMTRLTLIGSLYITFICLVPEFMRNLIKVPFYFGGTSLLIVVVVIIDFINQIQTIIMSSQYESRLKKNI